MIGVMEFFVKVLSNSKSCACSVPFWWICAIHLEAERSDVLSCVTVRVGLSEDMVVVGSELGSSAKVVGGMPVSACTLAVTVLAGASESSSQPACAVAPP